MAQSRVIERVIDFPLGGLSRTLSFAVPSEGEQQTTPLCSNVAPFDPSTDRLRGGMRPVCKSIASLGNAPYHTCQVSYIDSGTKEGVLLCNAGGTVSSLDGATWTDRITTNPSSDFSTCAYFLGRVYQATSGANCKEAAIPAGSDANLSNAGGGTAPTNCGLVWVHQGRLALSGKSDGAHQVFMSATGDATNWDYADRTEGGAWANTGTYAGMIGQMVVAAIAATRNTSYIGSPRSIYAINGNPRVGGTVPVSNTIGPLMNNAWCKGKDASGAEAIFMVTYDGLYSMPAGGMSEPTAVSAKKIPRELKNIEPALGDKVCIGYDSRWPAVHISVDYASGSDVNLVYHVPSDSWWQWTLPITPHVYASFPAIQTLARSAILPIGNGGSVRQYDYAAAQGGSNESFDSYVLIPIPISSPGSEGIIHALSAALAKDSNPVVAELYCGQSAEEAFTKAEAGSSPDFTLDRWTYTSTQYWNHWQHPRVRGNFAYLKLKDYLNQRFLVEQMVGRFISYEAIRRAS